MASYVHDLMVEPPGQSAQQYGGASLRRRIPGIATIMRRETTPELRPLLLPWWDRTKIRRQVRSHRQAPLVTPEPGWTSTRRVLDAPMLAALPLALTVRRPEAKSMASAVN